MKRIICVAVWALLSACGSTPEPEAESNTPVDPCATVACERGEQCRVDGDVALCEESCDPSDPLQNCGEDPCTLVCESCESQNRTC
ncbi:MAG: hypothetical protein AAFY60_15805, partial [Myxococcota bacterium]